MTLRYVTSKHPPQATTTTTSRSSLVARVATGTAIAAAGAALVAAIVSLVIADRIVLDAEDRRLRVAAAAALHVLPGGESDAATLKRAIEDEENDLAPESIRIAVRDPSSTALALLGGDAQLPIVEPNTCNSHEARGSTHRSCAAKGRGGGGGGGGGANANGTGSRYFYVVASAARAPRDIGGLFLSSFVAVGIAAAVAAFGGRRAARWALEPLTRLRESLDQITALDPQKAIVSGDDNCREVAALRAALASLVTRLAESLDSARRFSADAAHELKTPLTVISGELDLLAEEPLDEASRAAVEKLRSRVGALAKLVERLLALANATADRSRLTTEAVALEDIARDVIARLRPAARARVTLRADAPGMVLGDELLLSALVENAIDNALKFSGAGEVDVHVSEEQSPELQVVIDVTDDGPGISNADRERAFEAFFRTPESRAANTSGHGVGLALVAQIASAHSGAARFVDVLPGDEKGKKGARLRVTLPTWSADRSPIAR